MPIIGPKKEQAESLKKNPPLTIVGIVFILLALILLAVIYFPIIKIELNYQINKNKLQSETRAAANENSDAKKQDAPADENFSVIIPKIGINSKVIPDVNTNDAAEYQKKLAEGIAHAKGSAYPGEMGDVFLFAHSGANFKEALRFNAVFYLLNKLEIGDEVFVYYKGKKSAYRVLEKKIASPNELTYNNPSENPRLILMTCWPPGTTLKRIAVIAG